MNTIMNKLLLSFLLITLVVSCTTTVESDLDKLFAKRDSLQVELKSINDQILEQDTAKLKDASRIRAEELAMGSFQHFFEVQGIVEAQNSVTIVAEMPALIKKIYVKEGDRVKKGKLLVELDGESIQKQIDELDTKLRLATFVYEKQGNLRKENIGSELEYETAKNNKESLESALETAKTQLSKTRITAPYSGVVDDIFPREGELAGPSLPMIRFVSLGEVNIKVDVPESYLTKIKKGDQVEVLFPDLGIEHRSKITQRGSYIEPLNRTFKITVDLPQDDNLLPNLIGVVRIKDFELESALLIKQANILQDSEGKDYVFVVEKDAANNIAKKVFVERGISYNGISYITKGLKVGDMVISDGARSIVDGEHVQFIQ